MSEFSRILTGLEEEIDRLQKLVEAHEEYEALLVQELHELVGLAYVHGWSSSRAQAGDAVREKIRSLELG